MSENLKCYNDVEIYRRFLKYPFGLPKRKGISHYVKHILNNGRIEYKAPDPIGTEDTEVLYTLFTLIQQGKTMITLSNTEKIPVTCVETTVQDIAKELNTHNYQRVLDSLRRLKGLSMHCYYGKKKEVHINIIYRIEYFRDTGGIRILIAEEIYRALMNKTLTISYDTYIDLSPTAKNLYTYLTTNSGDTFKEDTMIERAVILASRKCDAQVKLREAVDDLKNNGIIRDYSRRKKDGTWYITIDRKRQE